MTALIPNLPDLEAALASNADARALAGVFAADTLEIARSNLHALVEQWDNSSFSDAPEESE